MYTGKNFIIEILKPFWKTQLLLLLVTMLTIILSFPTPFLIKHILDNVLINKNIHQLNLLGISIVLLTLLMCGFNYLESIMLAKLGQSILLKIKQKVFSHIMYLKAQYFLKNNSGYLSFRILNELNALTLFLSQTINSLVVDFLKFIIALIILFWINYKLALLSTISFPILFFLISKYSSKINLLTRENYELNAQINGKVHEIITGIFTIISFNKQKRYIEIFQKFSINIRDISLKISKYEALFMQSIFLIVTLTPFIIIWIGCYNIVQGTFTIGSLFVFYSFLSNTYTPLFSLANSNINIQQSRVSLKRILDLLNYEQEEIIEQNDFIFSIDKGIQFNNIYFNYEKKEILNNISLNFAKNKITTILGPSGVGKSTIINLILRFIYPNKGQIIINNMNINDISLRILRDNISFVEQEVFLFNTSVYENITLGNDISIDSIKKIAKKYNLDDFIENLPDKYNTVIGEKGCTLSTGQKQKIAILRALIKETSIIIFDEPSAPLDKTSEADLIQLFQHIKKNRIIIIVTHSPKIAKNSDKTYVIKQGRLIDSQEYLSST